MEVYFQIHEFQLIFIASKTFFKFIVPADWVSASLVNLLCSASLVNMFQHGTLFNIELCETKDEEQKIHTFEEQNTDPPHLCFPPPQPTLGIDSSRNLIVYSECRMGFDVIVCVKDSERV